MAAAYDFVYFDLDDTLLDHRSAEQNALADLHSELSTQLESALPFSVAQLQHEYHESNVELWRRYSLAEITADQLRHDRFATVLFRHGLSLDPMQVSRRYMECYATHWSTLPGATEAFDTIAQKNQVGIITNGFASTQREKLERFASFRDASAAIVISEEFGHMKPSRKLFDHASAQSGCSGERILYVGDSWHSDVEGGLNAGWSVA
ncbi:MAG: HAD-IA family hydrolase, partial [Rhodothermales bacterium]|nr:HAD-IA family hydrolase [Rhodothermales bacterium]